jgi:hypothetical protein
VGWAAAPPPPPPTPPTPKPPIPNPQLKYYLFNIEILLKMNIYIHKEIKLINK